MYTSTTNTTILVRYVHAQAYSFRFELLAPVELEAHYHANRTIAKHIR